MSTKRPPRGGPPQPPPKPKEGYEDVIGEVVPDVRLDPAKAGAAGGRGKMKLTEERFERIVLMVKAGNYLTVAAQANGVSYSTLRSWRQKAEAAMTTLDELGLTSEVDVDQKDNPVPQILHDNDWTYLRFHAALTKAEAEAEAYAVGVVRKAMGEGHWAAAMTFLERKAPDRWRRRDRVEVERVGNEDDAGLLNEAAQGHLHDALRAAVGELEGGEGPQER